MIDATLVPAPYQTTSGKEKEIIDQKATPPPDWKPAQRRKKDTEDT